MSKSHSKAMLTKADIQFIKSLSKRTTRQENGLFIVEGEKMASEVASSHLAIKGCYVSSDVSGDLSALLHNKCVPTQISPQLMGRISSLKTPSTVLLVVQMQEYALSLSQLQGKAVIALDGVQDPGNLGTIIRLAEWFGITDIVCSPSTVDLYNSKVIQSTMGAVLRVKVHYCDLANFLADCKGYNKHIYGTFLQGRNLYSGALNKDSVLLFGSEGSGISDDLAPLVDEKITIPSFGQSAGESLNVAIATAIFCSELRR